jgi:hypothetical protein
MSRAQTRVDIATAMSAVPGITGYSRRPGTPRAGDAWPLWRGAERGQAGHTYIDTFVVMIALAGSEAAADEFLDSTGVLVEDALSTLMYVDSMAPVAIATDAGDSYGLMITGRCEL